MEKYKAIEVKKMFAVLNTETLKANHGMYAFMSEAQDVADKLNEKESQHQFEKVECSIWDITDLRNDFEDGLLYSKLNSNGEIIKIKSIHAMTVSIRDDKLYRKVEKPTLDMELGDLGFEVCNQKFIYDFNGSAFSFEAIHKLSEILKRHGK